MNLVLIDTKTHEVSVFSGRKVIAKARFNSSLDSDDVEQLRADPVGFLKAVSEQ